MDQLSREDIQAIAQELNKLNNQAPADKAQNIKRASAHADNKRQNMQQQPSKKTHGGGGCGATSILNNAATIGLFLFWATVFIILLIKLAPYI